jgi:U3 small nucleolar RNA-associated protein 25
MSFGFVYSFQLVNMLGESENRKCNVLFSRLDLLKVRSLSCSLAPSVQLLNSCKKDFMNSF